MSETSRGEKKKQETTRRRVRAGDTVQVTSKGGQTPIGNIPRHQGTVPTSLNIVLSLPSTRRGSWSSDGSLQTTGGRISPGIQERIQTLEAASSTAAAGCGSRPVTPEAPRTESDSSGESGGSDDEQRREGNIPRNRDTIRRRRIRPNSNGRRPVRSDRSPAHVLGWGKGQSQGLVGALRDCSAAKELERQYQGGANMNGIARQ
jgi:hypothetical protein